MSDVARTELSTQILDSERLKTLQRFPTAASSKQTTFRRAQLPGLSSKPAFGEALVVNQLG